MSACPVNRIFPTEDEDNGAQAQAQQEQPEKRRVGITGLRELCNGLNRQNRIYFAALENEGQAMFALGSIVQVGRLQGQNQAAGFRIVFGARDDGAVHLQSGELRECLGIILESYRSSTNHNNGIIIKEQRKINLSHL